MDAAEAGCQESKSAAIAAEAANAIDLNKANSSQGQQEDCVFSSEPMLKP